VVRDRRTPHARASDSHILLAIVSGAQHTTVRVRIPARFVGAQSGVEQVVIRRILTDHEIGAGVVLLVLICVVDFGRIGQRPPENFLSDQNVLEHVAVAAVTVMARHPYANVAIAKNGSAILPVGML
jgi:hypothetical protein